LVTSFQLRRTVAVAPAMFASRLRPVSHTGATGAGELRAVTNNKLADQLAESRGKVVQMTSNFEDKLKSLDLPNRLSLARVGAVPVFMAAFLLGLKGASFYVYVFACLTDFLDGFLARRWNQTSAFGAFLDPVADKVRVGAVIE
jgi:hypothetical protein